MFPRPDQQTPNSLGSSDHRFRLHSHCPNSISLMDEEPLQCCGTSNAGPSKPPPKAQARARSKSLGEPRNVQPYQTNSPPSAPPSHLRKIPRPPNAFILYRTEKIKELKNNKGASLASDVGLDKLDHQRQLSKIVGQLWRDETPEIKAAFQERARQAASEHRQRFPEHRFKPTPRKAFSCAPATCAALQTPETHTHTDFSPGDIRGPLSGSGSGSGRKRASLEGAKSKTSPYSKPHRRTSLASPSSPTVHQTAHDTDHQRGSVKTDAAPDPAAYSAGATQLTRSVSLSTTRQTQITDQQRGSARRSLDGITSQSAAPTHSFDAPVPQHLREHHVFLAPPPAPPLPIGHAITTNHVATNLEAYAQHHELPKPKCSLFDAVSSALPHERRAFLQASLVMKGYPFAVPADASESTEQRTPTVYQTTSSTPKAGQSTAPIEPSESQVFYTTALKRTHTWHSQGVTETTFHQNTGSEAPPIPQTSKANPSPLAVAPPAASSVNLYVDATAAARYGDLGDWSQPEPCFNTSQSQISCYDGSMPPPSASGVYYGQNTSVETSLQAPSGVWDDLVAYLPQPDSFNAIKVASYLPIDSNIHPSNSAFVTLSEPDGANPVQSNFFGFDGQLMAQESVVGESTALGAGVDPVQEELRQRRAVEELLKQMMAPKTPLISTSKCSLHPELHDGTVCLCSSTQQQVVLAEHRSDRQSWPQKAIQGFSESSLLGDVSQPSLQLGADDEACNTCCQPDQTDLKALSTAPASTVQALDNLLTESQVYDHLTSPTTKTNFSRPLLLSAQPQEGRESFFLKGPVSAPPIEQGLSTAEASRLDTAQDSTLDPADSVQTQGEDAVQMATLSGGSHQQRIQQSLRNWKAQRLNSFKSKLARAKHRSSPSSSSLSVEKTKNDQ